MEETLSTQDQTTIYHTTDIYFAEEQHYQNNQNSSIFNTTLIECDHKISKVFKSQRDQSG